MHTTMPRTTRAMLIGWHWISGLWTAYWALFFAWQWARNKTRPRAGRSSDIR